MNRRRRLPAAALVALLCIGTTASAQPMDHEGRPMAFANPSALVSATLAFNQPKKGDIAAALIAGAAKDAVLLAPDAGPAEGWLKARRGALSLSHWTPSRIMMACDGSYGVVHGHLRTGQADRAFAMLWRRDQTGDYRWVLLGFGGPVTVSDDPESIEGRTADCPMRRSRVDEAGPPPGDHSRREGAGHSRKDQRPDPGAIALPVLASGEGASRDASLHWRWTARPDARFIVRMTKDGQAETPVDLALADPAG